MSTRMPPRGGAPQRPPYRPPTTVRKKAASRERRRIFDVVVFIVVIALVAVFARQMGGPSSSANAGATQGASGTPAGTALPYGEHPRITELMASNRGSITDGKGKYCDWIEIYNPTNRPINLAGYALSDNMKKPTKFVMPFYMLEPGQYMIVYADGTTESTDTEIHANFKLKNASQELLMTDPSGNVLQQILYPALQEDHTWALDLATNEWAATDKYTPGYPNDEEGWAAYQLTRYANEQVVLNEVMAGNTLTLKDKDGEYSDWVELYNPTDKPIDITGWGLSNKPSEPKKWVFPKTVLQPGQYLVVFCSNKNYAVEGEELHTNFRLNAFQETVLLSNLRGQIVNGSQVQINRQRDDESFGRVPNSDTWQAFAHPTPGYPNDEAGWNEFQKTLYADAELGPVIISEVMGNNTDTLKDQFGEYTDWIELYNRSDSPVNLKGWGLTDDSDELGRWQFPDITLSPGKYITVFASGRNLTDGDALSKKKLHTDFGISSGGIVVLTTPDGKVADRCFVPILRPGLSYTRQEREGSLLFGFSTQPTPNAANAGYYPGMAPEPAFSIKAGLYDTEQTVELTVSDPNAKIYYTMDGKTPTANSTLYTGPITVSKNAAIRAVAYRDGYLPSNIVCSTYLINLKAFFGADVNLPVVSLVTDPDNLYDPKTGIYVHYNEEEWERPAHIELLEVDGTVGFSQDVGIKISGAQSKIDNDQKSFGVFARNIYGKNSIDYKIFPDLPYTSYKSLMLRNGGQDARFSRIRAPVQLGLVKDIQPDLHVETQSFRQSLLFVNGEFFGVYDIMEKINEHFIAQHHNVNPEDVTLLTGNGKGSGARIGSEKVQQEYLDLLEYVKTHDLSQKEHYDYVASKIDIDSYIDWCTLEIFVVNSDLGNIKFWKTSDPESKWRWIFYDLDYGFWFYPGRDSQYDDTFSEFLDPRGNGVRNLFSNVLIRKLLDNKEFREKFIKRFYYHATVTFETDRTLAKIQEMQDNIAPYMARDKERFPRNAGSVTTWDKNQVEILRKFAKQRPEYNIRCMYQYFKSHYGISEEEMDRIVRG